MAEVRQACERFLCPRGKAAQIPPAAAHIVRILPKFASFSLAGSLRAAGGHIRAEGPPLQ